MLAVFIFFFIYYAMNLAPGIPVRDSGEFIAVAATLGCAHPPGYPLYTLISRLFILIPAGNPAYRVNLVSAFFGALALSMAYLIIKNSLFRLCRPISAGHGFIADAPASFLFTPLCRSGAGRESIAASQGLLTTSPAVVPGGTTLLQDAGNIWNGKLINLLLPAAAVIILGFNPVFLHEAAVAEVFTLNMFITLLVLYSALSAYYSAAEGKPEKAALSGFSYAVFLFMLGMSNHHTVIFIMPGIFYLLFSSYRIYYPVSGYDAGLKKTVSFFIRPKQLYIYFSGLLPYLYLYFRSKNEPVINWGLPGKSLGHFFNVMLRRSYGTLSLAKSEHGFTFFQNMSYHLGYFIRDMFSSGGFILLGFSLVFGMLLIKRKSGAARTLTVFYSLVFFFSGIFFVMLSNLPVSPEAKMMMKRFEIMPLFFFVIGIFSLSENLNAQTTLRYPSPQGRGDITSPLVGKGMVGGVVRRSFVIFPGLIAASVIIFSPGLKTRNAFLAEDYCRNLERVLPYNTVVFAKKDSFIFTRWASRYALGRRPDITVLGQDFFCGQWFMHSVMRTEKNISLDTFDCKEPLRTVFSDNQNKLELAVLYDYDTGIENSFFIKNKRPGFLSYCLNYDLNDEAVKQLVFRQSPYAADINDYFNYEVYEKYSLGYLETGKKMEAYKMRAEAVSFFRKALKIDRGNHLASSHLGYAYFIDGEYDKSVEAYRQTVSILDKKLEKPYYSKNVKGGFNKDKSEAFLNMGAAYEKLNNYQEAIASYRSSLSIMPSSARTHYNLGIVFWRMSDWKAVIREFEIVLSMEPQNAQVAGYMPELYRRAGNKIK